MHKGIVVKKNEYHDSVFLMRAAKRMVDEEGVTQAVFIMGTEKNKSLLLEIGFSPAQLALAGPGDLILAVEAQDETRLNRVLANMEMWLRPEPGRQAPAYVRSLDEALSLKPQANLAVISIPGEYAGREAEKALKRGLNVFIFSDNVSRERELSLKEYAREQGLIVMGPDCGTAIIGGVGIGFANAVRRGPVGVIGASGTGLQEFTCMVHKAGSGISQAIGIGGRDLSDEIGGISLLTALMALEEDRETETIAILSKPPGTRTLEKITQKINKCRKPLVICFLGAQDGSLPLEISFKQARTLDQAAAFAVENVTGRLPEELTSIADFPELMLREQTGIAAASKYIRGIFAGGTFCYQAQQILRELGLRSYSNAPLAGNYALPDPLKSREHTLVDMGADEFTVGRPHPMIDSRFRRERLMVEAQDPEVAVILLDFLLGFNAAADPAGELAPGIAAAKKEAEKRGGRLSVVASVCGTDGDSQDLRQQVRRLESEGVVVLPSSAQAARFAAMLVLQQSRGGANGR